MDFDKGKPEDLGISIVCDSDINIGTLTISMEFVIDNSLRDYVYEIVRCLRKYGVSGLDNNFKFWYYIKKSVLLLQLNDSAMKRYVIQELIYRKFTGNDLTVDDSDSPLTIALDSISSLTDNVLHLLFSYRLIINIIPSLLKFNRCEKISVLMSYIRATGSLNNCQVVNLRCIGLLYEMTSKTYSLDDESALTLIPEFYNLIDIENASLLSNDFTPAGLILTDIVAKYVFGLEEEFEYWLPEDNRVMHIKELVVDGDIKSEGNIVAYGDVSSGG